jgi:hypothetical protein
MVIDEAPAQIDPEAQPAATGRASPAAPKMIKERENQNPAL